MIRGKIVGISSALHSGETLHKDNRVNLPKAELGRRRRKEREWWLFIRKPERGGDETVEGERLQGAGNSCNPGRSTDQNVIQAGQQPVASS